MNIYGKIEILGALVLLREHEVLWRAFLESLIVRGLGGLHLITSDDHAGLRTASLAILVSILWQRCQFYS